MPEQTSVLHSIPADAGIVLLKRPSTVEKVYGGEEPILWVSIASLRGEFRYQEWKSGEPYTDYLTKEIGRNAPIAPVTGVLDGKGDVEVYDGSHRILASIRAGLKEVPLVLLKNRFDGRSYLKGVPYRPGAPSGFRIDDGWGTHES